MKWLQAGVRSAIAQAFKTSIFALGVDLVNVQPNRSKGCKGHNTVEYVKKIPTVGQSM